MIETVIKSPLLPDTIHFNHTMDNQTEVMRITRDGVWVNPDMQVDEIAKSVLHALDYQVKVLVQRAVEDEREACAKVCDVMEEKAEGTECCKWPTPVDCAYAIRARGDT